MQLVTGVSLGFYGHCFKALDHEERGGQVEGVDHVEELVASRVHARVVGGGEDEQTGVGDFHGVDDGVLVHGIRQDEVVFGLESG